MTLSQSIGAVIGGLAILLTIIEFWDELLVAGIEDPFERRSIMWMDVGLLCLATIFFLISAGLVAGYSRLSGATS
ncbi:MAG: hypothetical protein WAU10_15335 [Caldilineaceae bacterium]